MHNQNIKPNFQELARSWGCDYRTAKKYYYQTKPKGKKTRTPSTSILDPFKSIIEEKINQGVTKRMSIFLFIRDHKGYTGKYSTVRNYASSIMKDKVKKATIRIETTPGLSGQVDWKENMTLYNREGKPFTFNIFLFVLGYSRYKFVKLTLNRKQSTLFSSMCECFRTIEGIPKEIWFDNMKTVVDRSKSQFTNAVFNSSFYQFSKDMKFHPIACRAFRPQTKGKVEALAKLTERLRVYNYEFDDYMDLYGIVLNFMISINSEVSQATGYSPSDMWQVEKEHLLPLNDTLLDSYECNAFWRKVSQESMIMYQGNKYSVPIEYIGKEVLITLHDTYIHIYYNDKLIKKHIVSTKKYNYDKKDASQILKSDVFSYKSEEEIEQYIEENMHVYDEIL